MGGAGGGARETTATRVTSGPGAQCGHVPPHRFAPGGGEATCARRIMSAARDQAHWPRMRRASRKLLCRLGAWFMRPTRTRTFSNRDTRYASAASWIATSAASGSTTAVTSCPWTGVLPWARASALFAISRARRANTLRGISGSVGGSVRARLPRAVSLRVRRGLVARYLKHARLPPVPPRCLRRAIATAVRCANAPVRGGWRSDARARCAFGGPGMRLRRAAPPRWSVAPAYPRGSPVGE